MNVTTEDVKSFLTIRGWRRDGGMFDDTETQVTTDYYDDGDFPKSYISIDVCVVSGEGFISLIHHYDGVKTTTLKLNGLVDMDSFEKEFDKMYNELLLWKL